NVAKSSEQNQTPPRAERTGAPGQAVGAADQVDDDSGAATVPETRIKPSEITRGDRPGARRLDCLEFLLGDLEANHIAAAEGGHLDHVDSHAAPRANHYHPVTWANPCPASADME